METQTETSKGNGKGSSRKVVGRKDSEGQEAKINDDLILEREEELITLRKRTTEANDEYSTAIKKAAEDSGYNASTVRKYIEAKAGDSYDATEKKVRQLALIFGI